MLSRFMDKAQGVIDESSVPGKPGVRGSSVTGVSHSRGPTTDPKDIDAFVDSPAFDKHGQRGKMAFSQDAEKHFLALTTWRPNTPEKQAARLHSEAFRLEAFQKTQEFYADAVCYCLK